MLTTRQLEQASAALEKAITERTGQMESGSRRCTPSSSESATQAPKMGNNDLEL